MMPEDRKILQNNIMLLSRALLTLNDELKIRVMKILMSVYGA